MKKIVGAVLFAGVLFLPFGVSAQTVDVVPTHEELQVQYQAVLVQLINLLIQRVDELKAQLDAQLKVEAQLDAKVQAQSDKLDAQSQTLGRVEANTTPPAPQPVPQPVSKKAITVVSTNNGNAPPIVLFVQVTDENGITPQCVSLKMDVATGTVALKQGYNSNDQVCTGYKEGDTYKFVFNYKAPDTDKHTITASALGLSQSIDVWQQAEN